MPTVLAYPLESTARTTLDSEGAWPSNRCRRISKLEPSSYPTLPIKQFGVTRGPFCPIPVQRTADRHQGLSRRGVSCERLGAQRVRNCVPRYCVNRCIRSSSATNVALCVGKVGLARKPASTRDRIL